MSCIAGWRGFADPRMRSIAARALAISRPRATASAFFSAKARFLSGPTHAHSVLFPASNPEIQTALQLAVDARRKDPGRQTVVASAHKIAGVLEANALKSLGAEVVVDGAAAKRATPHPTRVFRVLVKELASFSSALKSFEQENKALNADDKRTLRLLCQEVFTAVDRSLVTCLTKGGLGSSSALPEALLERTLPQLAQLTAIHVGQRVSCPALFASLRNHVSACIEASLPRAASPSTPAPASDAATAVPAARSVDALLSLLKDLAALGCLDQPFVALTLRRLVPHLRQHARDDTTAATPAERKAWLFRASTFLRIVSLTGFDSVVISAPEAAKFHRLSLQLFECFAASSCGLGDEEAAAKQALELLDDVTKAGLGKIPGFEAAAAPLLHLAAKQSLSPSSGGPEVSPLGGSLLVYLIANDSPLLPSDAAEKLFSSVVARALATDASARQKCQERNKGLRDMVLRLAKEKGIPGPLALHSYSQHQTSKDHRAATDKLRQRQRLDLILRLAGEAFEHGMDPLWFKDVNILVLFLRTPPFARLVPLPTLEQAELAARRFGARSAGKQAPLWSLKEPEHNLFAFSIEEPVAAPSVRGGPASARLLPFLQLQHTALQNAMRKSEPGRRLPTIVTVQEESTKDEAALRQASFWPLLERRYRELNNHRAARSSGSPPPRKEEQRSEGDEEKQQKAEAEERQHGDQQDDEAMAEALADAVVGLGATSVKVAVNGSAAAPAATLGADEHGPAASAASLR